MKNPFPSNPGTLLYIGVELSCLSGNTLFGHAIVEAVNAGKSTQAIQMIRDQVADGNYTEVEIAIGRKLLTKILECWPVNHKKIAC